jgi:hypothetical protein
MLLLEAIELYGLYNWPKIGEHVGRAGEECLAHYFAVYVEVGEGEGGGAWYPSLCLIGMIPAACLHPLPAFGPPPLVLADL